LIIGHFEAATKGEERWMCDVLIDVSGIAMIGTEVL